MLGRTRAALTPVRLSLLVDAASEFAGAIVLVLAGSYLADAFNLDRGYLWLGAGVFALATIGVGALAVAGVESREMVLGLAGSNIAAGLAGWIVLVLAWGDIEPGGRWILSAAADSFVLIGLLELLALRRSPH